MVGWPNIWVEEELARVNVWPVFRDGELGFAGFDSLDEFFERAIFADQFEGGGGADFGDRVEVVAAEEDAEVNELENVKRWD